MSAAERAVTNQPQRASAHTKSHPRIRRSEFRSRSRARGGSHMRLRPLHPASTAPTERAWE
eukprot:4038299-Prymnesium_polylepis.1